jgi:hypothetical protein
MLSEACVVDQCPWCASPRLEYEFRTANGRVFRCRDCTLLFRDEDGSLPPLPLDYSERIADRLGHLVAATGCSGGTVLAVVPPGATGRHDRADVIAADDLLAHGAPHPPYGAIVTIDVLDRVADPAALLAVVRAALAPGAPASFSMPSVSSTVARYAGAAWHGFRSAALRFYGVDTLQSALVRAGFREPKFYTDGWIRPGSIRVRSAVKFLGMFGLRGPAVAVQRRAGALDESMTAIVSRGETITRHRLSVIVPVYNERATFRELMDRLIAKEIDDVDFEIIIVESNSTDGSRDEVLAYAGHPRVTVILQNRPAGKGSAVRAGLARATGDIVLFQDADLEYEIDDYDDLLKPICAYQRNFVIGSRHERKGSAWKIRDFNDAPVLSQVFNLGHVVFLGLLNGLYGQSLDDPFSMFKVFRRDCIAGLTFECDRFDFDFEIVIKLLRKGYRPLEIPVNYHSRSIAEGKKVSMLRDPLTWVRALVRFRTSDLYEKPRA